MKNYDNNNFTRAEVNDTFEKEIFENAHRVILTAASTFFKDIDILCGQNIYVEGGDDIPKEDQTMANRWKKSLKKTRQISERMTRP